MSTEAFTLQCHRCAGYFRAAGEARSKVRCPHCEWVALVAEFREIGDGELAAVGDAESPAVGDAGGSPGDGGGAGARDGFPRPAPRPAYSFLDVSATEEVVGPLIPWEDRVRDVLARVEG